MNKRDTITAKEYQNQFGQKKSKRKSKEESIHNQVCRYLDMKYPNVLYITDLSGVKLTIGQAVKAKRQRSKTFKIPDLTILSPSQGFHGLVIEIKKDVGEVFKKNGDLRNNKHIQEQSRSINHLNNQGYKALFGCGFDHCKNVIDKYLKQENNILLHK